jgi:thiamine biosynthesis protein ThiI
MMKYKGIVIHFGEIWLKGNNRGSFIGRLYSNIQCTLDGEKYEKLENRRDRFFLLLEGSSDVESICSKLGKVFGVSWFAPVVTVENNIEKILATSNKMLTKKDTVRIVPHRAFKGFSHNSDEIVGYFIKNSEKLNFIIDKDAEKDLHIDVTKEFTIIYDRKMQGAKGLPVGSSGNAVVLLSGGIDSPVASYYAMKRGLRPVYLHVHAFADNNDEKLSKITDLVKLLSEYSCGSKIYYLPGHVFQSSALKMPRKYELVLFKLFMYKLAEKVAKMEKAECIVSGESLGQVASQTTSNLITSEHGIKPLIMRPLIGFDKQEIIDIAMGIGTFDISIRKYRDVCSIAAKNPATGSKYSEVHKFWKAASIDSAIKATLKKMDCVVIE